MKDLRSKQRFQNFEKAYSTFSSILDIKNPNEAERMGLIQAFEIIFELSWKLLKDYLTEQGHIIKSPREAIKQAYQNEIIKDGHTWLNALENRNETVHTYNETIAKEVDTKIRKEYAPSIKNLHSYFKKLYTPSLI